MNSPISLFGQYSNMMAVNFLVYLIKVSGFFWRTSRPSFRSFFYDSTSKQHWGSWPLLSKVLYNIPSGFFHVKTIQESIVSNKKTHLADFETCTFRVYLWNHLSYKRLFTSICILVWRAFWWKSDFWNLVTKSADIFKNAVLPEKSKLLEKIRHFEKIKNFFHGSNV